MTLAAATDDTPAPWERQCREPPRAWHGFTTYRDLGPGKRSITEVARKLNVSRTVVGRWSGRWAWVPRCDAWDRHLDAQWRAELAQQQVDVRRRHLAIGSLALNRVVERLQNLGSGDLRPQDLANLLRVAGEMQRLAIATDEDVVDSAGGGPILQLVDEIVRRRNGGT